MKLPDAFFPVESSFTFAKSPRNVGKHGMDFRRAKRDAAGSETIVRKIPSWINEANVIYFFLFMKLGDHLAKLFPENSLAAFLRKL